MSRQNESSIAAKIIFQLETLSKEERMKVLNELNNKFLSTDDCQMVNEDNAEYEGHNNSSLSDFLGKKKIEHQQEEVNWINIKKEWIEQLNHFMKQIENWLEEQQSSGAISVAKTNLTLQEEYLGNYHITKLELSIGSKKIKIEPVGRLIIGAKGRIDIYSSYEKYILLYLEGRGWVYRHEMEKGKFYSFTKESFERILGDLL